MAALSSGQQQLMLDIAQDMPELYMKLDKCPSKANNDELQFLDKISVYLLKTLLLVLIYQRPLGHTLSSPDHRLSYNID